MFGTPFEGDGRRDCDRSLEVGQDKGLIIESFMTKMIYRVCPRRDAVLWSVRTFEDPDLDRGGADYQRMKEG